MPMGRPKWGNKNSDKIEQGGRQKATVEAIKDRWQACLKALEQPLPLAVLSIVQELAGFKCPSRPSLPLAQASKLAAHCAITLHLRREDYRVPEPKLQEVVLNLINKATNWAWEGLNTYRSGVCTKLWMALAFLVEPENYRQTLQDFVAQLAQTLIESKDDEIEEAPKQPRSKSQSGGESAAQGSGRGMLQALHQAKRRVECIGSLESGMTLEFQYAAFLFRLFVLQVVDHLYAPLGDAVKEEQKQYAQMMWQVQILKAERHLRPAHHNALPDSAAQILQGQMFHEPGKFRLMRHLPALESLILMDQPTNKDIDPHEALPARRVSNLSRFFERREEEVISNKGRLHAAKEREANEKAKLVLDYWSTLAEGPASIPRLVELLEVPLPLLRTSLEQQRKEGHDKEREDLVQCAALQATVLEDCVNSGKAFASLSCDGQASMPSFTSEFADALAQLENEESKEQDLCHSDDTAQDLYDQVIEGRDILWEGELPSSLSMLSDKKLEQALLSQHSHEAGGAGKTGTPRLMNALFSGGSASCLGSALPDAQVVGLLARSLGGAGGALSDEARTRKHPEAVQECAAHLHELLNVHEAIKYCGLGAEAALPVCDAFNMEVVAHASVDESFHVGCCNLKEVLRPTLADLRVITGPPEDGAQARRRLHDRPACHPKFEPLMDLDEAPPMNERGQALAQVCRGRLVLAMQFWLWRMQAWLHEPSWTPKPGAPVHLAAQEESVRGLCEALRLNDEELLQTAYVVVNTSPQGQDPKDESFFGPLIDDTQFCRYRFTPAEECPGSASLLQGLEYTFDTREGDKLVAGDSSTDGAGAQPKQDTTSAASGDATDVAHGHEKGSQCGAECFLDREWLGNGPSPLHFPGNDAYYMRDPGREEEMIDEILDILEVLRLSNLLSMDIVRGVAIFVIGGLRISNAHVSGANLLQVTWEHMTLLPAHALTVLRDSLLKCLGQHWRWTHPVRETEDRVLLPLGCFQLKPDRSAFQLVQVPVKQEIFDEAMARTKSCSCCQPDAEHAPKELPGPPANPPKQPRSRGRPECQSHDSGSQPSGMAGAGASITAASSAPDLAQELHDAYKEAQKLSKFIVETLYGAGNNAAAMLPCVSHMPRTDGCALYKKQMLCAAACAKMVKKEIDHKDRLSRSLQKAMAGFVKFFIFQADILDLANRLQQEPETLTPGAIQPLVEVFEDVQRSAAGMWAGAIIEVERQAATVRAQSSAVMAVRDIDKALLSTHIAARDSSDDTPKVRQNLLLWENHTTDVLYRLEALKARAAPKRDRIPTPEQLSCIMQQPQGHSIREMGALLTANFRDLREAVAAGMIALTSAEQRLAALRTAVISVQRRLEQELKLYCGDVLQTSLAATLSEKLLAEAHSEMEEKRRKAEELLLFGEAQSEKQRLEAAAKRAAKKERQLRQKAEAQRAADDKAAAEAASAERAVVPQEQASQQENTEAHAAADEVEAEGSEVPIMEGTNGAGPVSGLQSHSLGGDAYSEDEYEEASGDKEQEPSNGVGSAPEYPREVTVASEPSPDRGADSSEQHEASSAAAQKKKRNKGGRKRAAAVRAGSKEPQQHSSSAGFLTDWQCEAEDDGSEWQEAKPKRSHQRKEQQQQREEPKQGPSTLQKPQQGLNGHSISSSGHDRPPAAASAAQQGDPIIASLNRPKPEPSSRDCAKCGDAAHRVMECPQLQSLRVLDRADCCVALMDGDHARVTRIWSEPRRSCHVCDAAHDVWSCPWLQGMPEVMREDLKRTYKTLRIREKDKILRHWVEIRRDLQRKLPAAFPAQDKSGASNYTSPSKPLQPHSPQHSASRAGKLQGPPRQHTAQHERRSAPIHGEHARHDSATSAARRPAGQQVYPVGGRQPNVHTQAAQQQQGMGPALPTASSQDMSHVSAQTPRMRQREQDQGTDHSETAYDTADDEAASELGLVPSPARPQPRNKSHSATREAPAPHVHSDPYAGFEENWEGEGSEAEETTHHQVNPVGGMEPAVGLPVRLGVTRADVDFDSLMTMLRPQPTGPKGWSKVVVGEAADSAVDPTPAEAQRSAAAAAQARQEEDDMQAAIQASITQTRPAPAQLARIAQQAGPPQPQQQLALAGPGVGTPGLQNQIGEYNCFLNVVVQCLWHCRDFKRRFSGLAHRNPATVQSNDVVAGLADLFSKFDAQERQAGEQQEPAERQIVAPTKLRDALHALDPQRFSTGEMSDAAEVLGAIYEQLAELPKIGTLATQVFELPVCEAVHCLQCGKDTHQSSFVQSFYCVSATALRMQAMLALADSEGIMPPLGELLLGIDAQDQKTCDTDEGGCGRLNHIQRFLEGVPPPVFTLQLAWESHAESTEAITEVLDAVQEVVDIGEIYKALGSKEYRLHSMVCYYGEHYHAFVHTEGRWVAFDDATLNHVGDWEDVVKKCILGKIQPSLLFYEEALGG